MDLKQHIYSVKDGLCQCITKNALIYKSNIYGEKKIIQERSRFCTVQRKMNTWICMFYFFGQMYTKVVCCTDIRKKGVSLDIDLIFLQLAADT